MAMSVYEASLDMWETIKIKCLMKGNGIWEPKEVSWEAQNEESVSSRRVMAL